MSFGASDDPPKPPPFAWSTLVMAVVTGFAVTASTKLAEWAVEELKAKRKPPEGPKP